MTNTDGTNPDRTQAEADLLADVARFFDMDARFIAMMQQGMLLAPSDTRLAGIFPKSESVQIDPTSRDQESEILTRHSTDLVKRYRLFSRTTADGSTEGLIPRDNEGCVCIMYLKEGESYRPVFGASGVDPYSSTKSKSTTQQTEHKSYADMGLPVPQAERHPEAVARLQSHMQSQKRLGIKLPAKQAQLYYLQYPIYEQRNKRKGDITAIGLLESWGPTNCAEPAIMTAIYQLYHQPRDIHLSTPFEGPLDKKDQPQLKYTCARCAMAEPAFVSPDKTSKHHRHVEMRIGKTLTEPPHEQLFDPNLIINAAAPYHPYKSEKRDKQPAAVEQATLNVGSGHLHVERARNPKAAKRKAQRKAAYALLQTARKANLAKAGDGK